jgi:hypothetical protein
MELAMHDRLTADFFLRLLIDLISVTILVRFIYHSIYRKNDFFFTFFLFNVVIFIITYMLNKVELSIGAAFGLFAVFSLLRYRTENIFPKDMTYLFLCIALGLITSVSKGSYFEVAIINVIILALTYSLDGNLFIKNELVRIIRYEKIENIKPGNSEQLIQDLKERTGLNIHKVDIEEIDFMRDSAQLKIYFYE